MKGHPKYIVHHNSRYEDWIRKKPCLVCGVVDVDCHHVYHSGSAKLRNSYLSVPLCRDHHTMGRYAYHRMGHRTFEDIHSLDLDWEVINYLADYMEEHDGYREDVSGSVQGDAQAEVEAFS